MFDLQLFADEPVIEPVTEPNTEPEIEPHEPTAELHEPETPPEEKKEPTLPEDSKPDYSKLGSMNPDQQYEYLKKAGIFGNKEPDKPPEQKPEEEPPVKNKPIEKARDEPNPDVGEQAIEVNIGGQSRKVKPSELAKLIADQRRELDAMNAAIKVQQQTNPQAGNQTKPADNVQNEYQQAIAQAEISLGIKAGDFNQFDPAHNFALQKVIAQANTRQVERQAVQQEINDFVQTAKQDPLSEKIDNNFDVYLFKLGTESPEGAQKAQSVMLAKQRLFGGQATKADTALLKEHWNYVKQALSKPVDKPKPVQPKPEPPKTETPGTGKDSKPQYHLDYSKLGKSNAKQQFEMLKKAGFFNAKKEG